MDELGRLQSLHRDLLHLNESRIPNVERLVAELEAHIEDFRNLLGKPARSDKSRQTLASGSIELDGTSYTVNNEFQQAVLQLAEVLDLDEIEAARLYMLGEEDCHGLDRSPLASAIITFHQRRQFMLECIRLILEFGAQQENEDDDLSSLVKQAVGLILQISDSSAISGSEYWRKCFSGMQDIEAWLQNVADRIQGIIMTGQTPSAEFTEIMDFQCKSLTKQHESLGVISCLLIKENHTSVKDFESLLARLKAIERYDVLLVHYIPSLICSTMQFAPSSNASSDDDARRLQGAIVTAKEQEVWALRTLQAAAKVLWLAEYSARFFDAAGTSRSDVEGGESGIEKRSAAFMEGLRDGAFQFLLSVGRDIKDDAWSDPLRHGVTQYLTSDTPALTTDPFRTDERFQDLLKLQLQGFVESFITFMPDTLRQLKVEEDEQRRQMHSVASMRSPEHDLHLERFLVVVAYAYEGFSDAAESFWDDREGNLFGFLQWAGQRQSTPRVGAFCQMLRALSEGEKCADSAHSFLLGETTPQTFRSRRISPLSWAHIFSELEFYSAGIREKPLLQTGKPQTELVEPESAMMLECYLRLLRHLSINSSKARNWLITNTFRVHEHLLLLCGGSNESRLRACAFAALAGLMIDKEKEVCDAMWTSLDAWISGGSFFSNGISRPSQQHGSSIFNEHIIFESLAAGFEESNAFVELVQALVSPPQHDAQLTDSLPFPESLGAAYRMPGIEPYVDFVLGRVFAVKSVELLDPVELRIMRWNCLNFAYGCLSTFNEELMVFANQSNVAVDGAIRTSSLAAYARIHPFSRVMEWFFNDAVIAALFASAVQDISIVNDATPNSPLVLGLLRSIQIIDLILTLQSTYFEIVRPIVKLQSTTRRPTVANSALSSFEDAILNNINIVTSLGMYCGTGHEGLAIASIRLLHKLSSSRKLTAPLTGIEQHISQKSRLIVAMERNNEVESVSRTLIDLMRFESGQFEQGAMSPGMVIKAALLEFLNESIAAIPDHPSIAHLLLGFTCHPVSLDVSSNGLFARGESLFHAVVKFMMEIPSTGSGTILSWLTSIRSKGMQLLSKLWKSQISMRFVLPELRHGEFLFSQWLQQPVIGRQTLWDGRSLYDPEFFLSESAVAYVAFLDYRSALLDYIATELKSAGFHGLTTLRDRIQAASLGIVTFPDGQQVQCAGVYDFADFLKLDMSEPLSLPESTYFQGIDFSICVLDAGAQPKYNLQNVEQLLRLRHNELSRNGQLSTSADELQMQADANNFLQCLKANNNRIDISITHMAALQAWVRLVLVFLECTDLKTAERNAFILQGIQLVLQYIERSLTNDMATACVLAQIAKGLMDRFDLSTMNSEDKSENPANDKLFQVFRTGLVAIQYPDAPVNLRQTCYILCYRYISTITAHTGCSTTIKYILQSIKSLGDRLTEVICDDAYASEGICRTAALLLLGSIITASNHTSSRVVIDSLSRSNFIQMMVNGIRLIPDDLLRTTDSSKLLPFYDASLALLLRIAQSRPGATFVMSAGIFASIRDSRLFDADPDIGLDVEDPAALTAYFKLISGILRIITAIVLSRGGQNEQTISEARHFLEEHRMNIMSIFKRSARIGFSGVASSALDENEELLQELVDNFTILISASDFLATEQQVEQSAPSMRSFT